MFRCICQNKLQVFRLLHFKLQHKYTYIQLRLAITQACYGRYGFRWLYTACQNVKLALLCKPKLCGNLQSPERFEITEHNAGKNSETVSLKKSAKKKEYRVWVGCQRRLRESVWLTGGLKQTRGWRNWHGWKEMRWEAFGSFTND